jgi:hypothetical protein
MIEDLNTPAFVLAQTMSSISERCYCAGWMMGCEYTLWDAVVNRRPTDWGQGRITERDIQALQWLSDCAGGWIVWDDDTSETFVPIEEWKDRYSMLLVGEQNG